MNVLDAKRYKLKVFISYFLILLLINGELSYAQSNSNPGPKTSGSDYTLSNQVGGDAKEKEKSAIYWQSLTLFAAAFLGTTFLIYCRNLKSVWLYTATAVLYVAAELLAFKDYKGLSEQEMEIYEGEDVDKQAQAFEAAEKQTRKAAETMDKKAKYAKYASYGFYMAAALALLEKLNVVGDAASNKCTSSLYFNNKGSMKLIGDIKREDSFFDNIINIFIPKACALSSQMKGVGLGLIGAGAMYYYLTTNEALKSSLKSAMSSGIARAVVFGATGLLASNVSKKFEETAEILHERADQYKYLKERVSGKIGAISVSGATEESAVSSSVSMKDGKIVKTLSSANCYTGEATALKLDANCDCKVTNSCKVSELSQISFSNTTPTTLTKGLSDFGKMSNAIYSSNPGAAQIAGTSLTRNAVAMKKLRRKLEKAVNKKLKAKGKKPLNFEKLQRNFAKKMIQDSKRAFASLTPLQQSELKESGFSGASDKAIKKLKQEIKKKESGNKSGGGPNKTKNDFKFSFDDDTNANEVDSTPVAEDETNVNYDYNSHNDIIDKNNTPIFKIISTRYLKSAFPILFDEEQEIKNTPERK